VEKTFSPPNTKIRPSHLGVRKCAAIKSVRIIAAPEKVAVVKTSRDATEACLERLLEEK
jgi:hypothetical protein